MDSDTIDGKCNKHGAFQRISCVSFVPHDFHHIIFIYRCESIYFNWTIVTHVFFLNHPPLDHCRPNSDTSHPLASSTFAPFRARAFQVSVDPLPAHVNST